MDDRSDEKLITAVRSKDYGAYVELVERHYRCVFAVCMGVFGNVHDAEDAAQEAIIKGLKKIDSLEDAKQFKHWITRIAKNYCFDVFRQRKRQTELNKQYTEQIASSTNSDDSLSDLHAAILQLPAELRLPLMMFYFENRSTRDIAVIMDMSHSGLCQRLKRARQQLHDLLIDQGVIK